MSSGFSGFKNVVVSVSVYHARVIQGVYFQTDHFDADVPNDETIDILVQVGELSLHARHFSNGGGDTTTELFEAPTFTDPGTTLTLVNLNRTSDYAPTPQASLAPIGLVLPASLDILYSPGGHGGNANGSEGTVEVEWILKANTDYLWRLTNIAGNTQAMHLHLEWYEEVGGGHSL